VSHGAAVAERERPAGLTSSWPYVAVTAAAAVLLAAGCTSAAPHRASAGGVTKRELVRLAKTSDGGGQVVRLGVVPELADGIGLTAAQLGYFQRALGAGARLQLVPFSSALAEAGALAAGRLDAAYLDPVEAVRLWLASPGGRVKVVAGAASSTAEPGRRGRSASTLLVFTQSFLAGRPGQVTAVLKGDILASQLLATDPARGRPAVAAELAALLGRRVRAAKLARSFRHVSFTNDPLASSVSAEARRAAAAGLLGPLPRSLAGLYDLGPLNRLLRSAGEPAVTG